MQSLNTWDEVIILASCNSSKFGNGGYERSTLSQTFQTAKTLRVIIKRPYEHRF